LVVAGPTGAFDAIAQRNITNNCVVNDLPLPLAVAASLLLFSKKYFCVLSQFEHILWLRFPLEALVLLGVLLVSKTLKEASLLGFTFLLGLAAIEVMLHFAGF
tara:strand:+ start:87 stop:395 length:309 start_codon:yes stop_codon:yes gene_type:complete